MTNKTVSQDLPSDSEAKRIAGRFTDHWLAGFAFGRFRQTGQILVVMFNYLELIADPDDKDVLALRRYVQHHGRRGPVDGWEAI